jgi:hypothetical protein
MKAIIENTTKDFKKIGIVLESLEEVDKMAALLTHDKFTSVIGVKPEAGKKLLKLASGNLFKWQDRLNNILKPSVKADTGVLIETA